MDICTCPQHDIDDLWARQSLAQGEGGRRENRQGGALPHGGRQSRAGTVGRELITWLCVICE
jgi:hypothetical protein